MFTHHRAAEGEEAGRCGGPVEVFISVSERSSHHLLASQRQGFTSGLKDGLLHILLVIYEQVKSTAQ